ncbi:hypothetical protein AVDCRST_MAG94-5504, partial [uncultured Leptolyngbya sp.]
LNFMGKLCLWRRVSPISKTMWCDSKQGMERLWALQN